MSPQLLAVEVLVRLAQALPELDQRVHLVRLLAHEQVAGPGGQSGAAQLLDLFGQFPVTGFSGRRRMLIRGCGELVRPQPVQLVGDSLQVHGNPFHRICCAVEYPPHCVVMWLLWW
ncbi:hypothetical protein [Streptomyces pristinaespiralis]|uniref:hypothetical protein n=1 Tax=Streptomyces pristinaespiralis TaxID=38300 RepID=UPI0033F413F8